MVLLEGDITKQSLLSEGLAITIGNFDGVHRGHVHLVRELQMRAKNRGLRTAILSFDPHPEIFFNNPKFHLLNAKSEKIERLSQLNLDFLLMQNFNQEFAERSGEDFLRHYLINHLDPQLILFGYDFRYGNGGTGDFALAQKMLSRTGIEIAQGLPLQIESHTLSSSLIRQKLAAGEIEIANQWLGYNYSIAGHVVASRGLGKQIGFPTANLQGIQVLIPGQAVYAGRAHVCGRVHNAVLNIGNRPTVENTIVQHIECHILDFSESIYGQSLRFEFVKKLRGELKFPNVDALKFQIQADIDLARKIL